MIVVINPAILGPPLQGNPASFPGEKIIEGNGKTKDTGYPLVNVYIAMENHHAMNGKTNYFNGHVQ